MKMTLQYLPLVVAVLIAGCDISQSPTPPTAMSEDSNWNDTTRRELRETLRNLVSGEVRLANSGHDDIIQICREVYIEDECPKDEWEMFVRFATDQLEKAAAKNSTEQAAWPPETDCDRLDRVEATLRDRGILLWQVSPCCDTCTGGELSDRIDEIDRRHPGFRKRIRGYAFFIDQNMADMLAEDTHVSVYLAYGWFSPDDSNGAHEVYEGNALGIAREICDCLREHGFEPDWDGSFSKKIGVSLNWQRRTILQ
jgi:Domain of unknown function (DUF6891)